MLESGRLDVVKGIVVHNAWYAARNVIRGFLGNNNNPNYRNLVVNFAEMLKNVGCCMSLKLQFLHSQLDFFLTTLIKLAKIMVRDHIKISQ